MLARSGRQFTAWHAGVASRGGDSFGERFRNGLRSHGGHGWSGGEDLTSRGGVALACFRGAGANGALQFGGLGHDDISFLNSSWASSPRLEVHG